MGNTKKFDNILDECIGRVSRGETVEQCLASYPDQAAELEPLLRTVLVARRVSAIQPRPEFKNRARYAFRVALAEKSQEKHRSSFLFGWQPRWATAAIAVLIIVVAGSGTLAAANNSMPDDALYPVKLTAETVQIALTPSDMGKAQLYASLADKRVAEIVKMADKGKTEQVERATDRMDAYLQRVASLAAPEGKQAASLSVPAPAAAPAPSLTQAQPSAPAAAARAPLPSATLSPTPRVGASQPPAAPPTPTPTPTPTAGQGQVKGSVSEPAGKETAQAKNGTTDTVKKAPVKADKQREDVKAAIAAKAAKNAEDLKATLKKAPDSAKPALRRAIQLAEARYREALDALDK